MVSTSPNSKLTKDLPYSRWSLPKLTLFWRLFLAMLGIVLLTSILAVFVERTLTAQTIDQRMRKQVTYLLEIQSQIAQHLETGNTETIEDIYQKNRRLAHQIFVVDSAGEVLFPNESMRLSGPRSVNSVSNRRPPSLETNFGPLPPLANSGRAALTAWREGTDLPETTVTLQNGTIAKIQLYPRLPYRDIIAMKQGYFGLRIALLLLFSVLVCYWLSRTMTGRIQQVQKTVHQLSRGDYQAGMSLASLGDDELGALAKDIAILSGRLSQSEQARQQMLSDISHELRSPLARLEVATELARDQAPQSASYFDRIQRESARMNALIGQIIHIQSLQMGIGSGQPSKEACDIVQIIQQIGADVCFEFQQKHIHWHYHGPESLTLLADSEQIYSALENIIRNAFIHTPAEHQVRIDLTSPITGSDDQNQLQIDIIDEGEGIEDSEIGRIFQPFVRLDSARPRQTGGHGLGLAIAHAIISAHGGQIEATNRHGGSSGLIVRVTLPINPHSDKKPPPKFDH